MQSINLYQSINTPDGEGTIVGFLDKDNIKTITVKFSDNEEVTYKEYHLEELNSIHGNIAIIGHIALGKTHYFPKEGVHIVAFDDVEQIINLHKEEGRFAKLIQSIDTAMERLDGSSYRGGGMTMEVKRHYDFDPIPEIKERPSVKQLQEQGKSKYAKKYNVHNRR